MDEHECTPSVHDQTSKGNYDKDADIKKQFKIVLILIYSIALTFKIKYNIYYYYTNFA